MKVLKKAKYKVYDWLNFERLPDSDGYKFEVYPEEDLDTADYAILFYSLFRKYKDKIMIRTFHPEGSWGNFCLDVWDINKDEYDYSPEGKSEPTSNYLQMLIDSEIEPEYNGFCKCLDWDKFLVIILDCIFKHTAIYSLMFYIPKTDVVFYFHHTHSFGVYYRKLNNDVLYILERIKEEGLKIENTNDKRLEISSAGS